MSDQSRFAKPGTLWVCSACGKTHTDRYGLVGAGSSGWDESCMLNAVLCHEGRSVNASGIVSWTPVQETAP